MQFSSQFLLLTCLLIHLPYPAPTQHPSSPANLLPSLHSPPPPASSRFASPHQVTCRGYWHWGITKETQSKKRGGGGANNKQFLYSWFLHTDWGQDSSPLHTHTHKHKEASQYWLYWDTAMIYLCILMTWLSAHVQSDRRKKKERKKAYLDFHYCQRWGKGWGI